MELLNEIINQDANQTRGFDGGAHSFKAGSQITESGIRHVESSILSNTAYRGYGVDVSMCNNDRTAIADKADMNWKTIAMPLAIQGRSEYRPFPGMVALVRSDNGAPLSVATTDYKPHHNSQLLGNMCEFASEAGLKLSRIGLFDGGERGFAVATSGVNRGACVGDAVSMHIVLRFGHKPGTATSFRAWANELRCSNGMCVEVAAGKARFVHSAELTPGRIAQARVFVNDAAKAFNGHVDKLEQLRKVKSNKGLDLMQLAVLFQPALVVKIQERLDTAFSLHADSQAVLGERIIASILERDRSVDIVSRMINDGADRLLNNVILATVNQPGGQYTVNTMAHAFSGVTNYNSNVRGRSAETGLEANLFGTSQEDSRRALVIAVDVAERVGRMN